MATILDPGGSVREEGPAPASPAPPPTAEYAPAVRLTLLDGFELSVDGAPVDLPASAQRLLAFLALQERPVLREYLAACLWTQESIEQARANLRAALDKLRLPGVALLVSVAGHLQLNPDVSVDLREAIDGARTLLNPLSDVVDGDFEEFLMSGDVLPAWPEDWVLIERERLRQLRLHALEALCARLTAARRLAEAIDVGLAAVAADPLRESSHRVLIRAHLSEGNRAEAIRQFETYRDLLWSGLGVTPSEHMHAVMTEGLADRRDAAVAAPPPSSPRRRPKPEAGAPTHAPSDEGKQRPRVDKEEAR